MCKKIIAIMLAVALVFSINACKQKPIDGVENNISRVEIDMIKARGATGASAFRLRAIQQAKANAHHHPGWLKKPVEVHVRNQTFAFVAEKILPDSDVYISIASDLSANKKITMDYLGSARGALAVLAAKSGYAYAIEGNHIAWSQQVTQSFDISFMPGAATYSLGNGARDEKSSFNRAISADPDSQYSNLRGHLSVWDDLRLSLEQLKSSEGSISISEATTTVTVKDSPSHVKAIARYLEGLNRKLSREVALSVQVLEIDLSNGFNYGIDWQLVRKVMDLQLGLTGQLAKPVRLTALGENATAGEAGFILQSKTGEWAGTDMLINALSQQGRVATLTRPRVVTLNNQVAEIDINQQTGYLREVTSTTTGASPATVTSLTPGTIKTGFTLYILPKIQREAVYLQISSTVSSLLGIQTISANPNAFARDNTQIQLPTVSEKHFNQRSLVPNKATLVLTGFKQVRNEANRTKMFGSQALGSQGGKTDNTETLILITPIIISR